MTIQQADIRLACDNCFREDMDGITRADLLAAIKAGWKGVSRFQSYEESIKTYEGDEAPPPGYSVLDWYTHTGLCPECAAADEQFVLPHVRDRYRNQT